MVANVDFFGLVLDVKMAGEVAYVAVAEFGVQIVDISNPAAPVVLGQADSEQAEGVLVANGLAFVADHSAGLHIFAAQCGAATSADDVLAPTATRLEPIAPNPFRGATSISYFLPENTRTSLRIYNVGAQLIRVLDQNAIREAGQHRVAWDGRDDQGQRVPSGVYFSRLEAGRYVESRSMVLLK
jgi:FlgD Ig-like domain/LVIVD repeat